jgi:hypothetical protein
MPERRQVTDSQAVSYALARRATLAGVARGQVSAAEVCDAHPDLLRAARYYGEPTDVRCPICRKDRLTRVTYAYGDELQHASGRARPARTLPALAARFAQVRIYEVEVCRTCGWNHLNQTFLIGTSVSGGAGDTPARRPDAPTKRPYPQRREAQRRTARR